MKRGDPMKKPSILVRALCVLFSVYFALPATVVADLALNPPTFPSTNTVRITLSGAESTNAHVIFWTPNLQPNVHTWYTLVTGTVGQTTFDFTLGTNQANFFAAGVAPVVTPTVATPTFSPGGGSYGAPTNVVISCATSGALIYYTTNGSTPTILDNYVANGSCVYIDRITTLKAKAFAHGYVDSAVVTATYTINSPPSVSAGPQQILTSGSTTLQGFVSDDGLPVGGIGSTNWSQVSGPGTVTFGNAQQTNTTATFSSDGIYVLQLAAGDGQYTNTDLVTIAVNPSIAVSLTSPTNGASYTVPTNILLQATTSGSVTQVLFFANGAFIGEATGSPLSLNWKSATAGTLELTAVAFSDDTNNYSVASDPVTITVNWPTNVGQVAFNATDLQIPVSGLPLTIQRQYDTRGAAGSFGPNSRLDYEAIKIEKNASLAEGWTGRRSGVTYWVEDTSSHLVTVTLGENEKYYFRPVGEFKNGSTYAATINSFTIPRYQQGNRGRVTFHPVGSAQGKLEINPTPSNMGYDDYNFSGWQNLPVRLVQGGSLNDYDPSFSQYVFTAPDGTQYRFNSNGGLAVKTDRTGNSLTYSDGGIVHSSGKQLTFTRDASNNITEIYDPIAQELVGSPALVYSYDTNGNVTNFARLIQRSPAVYENTAYAYTNSLFPHHVTAVTDPRGVVSTRYVYDSAGRLTTQYDALNYATTYYYDTAGHRQVITDRNGSTTVQTFNPAGKVETVRDVTGGLTTYTYDEQGRKIAVTNPAGETTSYAYDQNNNVVGSTNALNNSFAATFNALGQPLVVTDAMGYSTTNEYDALGNLITIINALGITNGFAYDAQGNRTAETNAAGLPEQVTVVHEYDAFGNLTNVVTLDSLQTVASTVGYTYDSNGNKLSETKVRTLPEGGTEADTTQWAYDAANRVVEMVDPLGNTNLTSYNGINKQSQTIDALGRTNCYYYDAIGQLTNVTHPDGLSESFAYDAEGRKIRSTDRAGRTTTYDYDAAGRPTRTTFSDGSATENWYDSVGRLKRALKIAPPQGMSPGPTGVTIFYTYDAAGHLATSANVLNQTNYFSYDANGNQTATVDALGRTNTYVYDQLNRVVQVVFADGSSESFGYDGLNRRVAVTNQAAIVTLSGFDSLGRLVSITNALGTGQESVTRYEYDEIGNLLSQIDPLNHTNRFEYDSAGRKTKESLPGGQTMTFGYDAVGNLIRQTNFTGAVVTNQYNLLNQITNRTAAGGYRISLAYSPTGMRTNMIDASGTNRYAYDGLDRMISKISPQGSLTYTYDLFGNLATTESTTTNGTKVNYYYDALNRLTNVVDRFSNTARYSYDAVGNLQKYWYQNNVTNTYAYDALNRLTNIGVTTVSGTIASFAYKVAEAGNRTNLIENINGTMRTNQWRYDSLYRLTNETVSGASPAGSVSYQYDATGNRTNRSSTLSGIANQGLAYNSNDELATDVYDNNGNTKTNNGNTFLYDAENRLTNAVVGGTNIVIVYDGDGNRVKKTVGATSTYYLVDNNNPTAHPQVLEELSTIGGTPAKLYTYGFDLISQRQSDGTTSFYGYDGSGSVRFLTTSSGSITDTYAYDSYGNLIASTGTTPNAYRYSGECFDSDLGLYYLRARYLNVATGRFWTRDAVAGRIDDPQTLHRYLYCGGDPINRADPSGHEYSIGGVLTVISSSLMLAQISNQTASVAEKKAEDTVAEERHPANTFVLSQQGLQLIAGFEGFSATVYQDVAGYDTIGYGHKLATGEQQKFANGITPEAALVLLRSDARVAENSVRSLVTAPLNQNEYDALVSFTYNVGGGKLKSSTLLKKLNAKDYDGAAAEFGKWVFAGGKRTKGLVERRKKERILFKGELWLFRSELGIDPY